MKRESLYLEIGNIDDDLVEEAFKAKANKKSKINFARFVGAAACICLICTASVLWLQRDIVRFNTSDISASSKVFIPSDADVHALSEEELFDYYEIEQFPNSISDMQKYEQSEYFIYYDTEDVVYDTNVLNYASADGKQSMSVTITKVGFFPQPDNFELSRIDGVSLLLAVSEDAYMAELRANETYISIVSHGIDEQEFVNTIEDIIKLW